MYRFYFREMMTLYKLYELRYKNYIVTLWTDYFKKEMDVLSQFKEIEFRNFLKNMFLKSPMYVVFDIIEHVLKETRYDFLFKNKVKELNSVLRRENHEYRIVEIYFLKTMSDIEIEELEKTLSLPERFQPVVMQIESAIQKLSSEDQDLDEVIRESVNAVESTCNIINGSKTTLGQIIKQFNLHPRLQEMVTKLYGYCSSAGVRHGKLNDSDVPDFHEAKLILVLCSAVINYLIFKDDMITE